MLLLGLVVVLLVVRPLVRRIITPNEAALAVAQTAPAAAPPPSGHAQLPPPGGMIALPDQTGIDTSKTARMIDIAQVKGQVHAQSVQKVGELAEQNQTRLSRSSVNGSPSLNLPD